MRSIPLSVVRVRTPCEVPWANMHGDALVRFCDQCTKNVYNISDMTTAEAQTLINTHEGRLCIRYFQRVDGTIVTKDCTPAEEPRRPMARWLSPVLAAVGFVTMTAMPVRAHFEGLVDLLKVPDKCPPSNARLEVKGEMIEMMGDMAVPEGPAPAPPPPPPAKK